MARDAEPAFSGSAEPVVIGRCGRDAGASRDLHRGLRSLGIRPGDRLYPTARSAARAGWRPGCRYSAPRSRSAPTMSGPLYSIDEALAWATDRLRAASPTPRL